MQSANLDVPNDNNNTLITTPKECNRPKITMIPESFTSSDTEDDGKHDVTPETGNPENTNETLLAWFRRFTQMQSEIQKKIAQQAENTAAMPAPLRPANPPAQRVVKYQDLPYMGEMTLDNSKPRRGRKPKKADICHLIYKNYGTIFPGTPNSHNLVDRAGSDHRKMLNVPSMPPPARFSTTAQMSDLQHDLSLNRSDVQHRIISSLLEKRLTQESKRQLQQKQQQLQPQQQQNPLRPGTPSVSACKKSKSSHVEPEPLNLCIRDLDHLNIRFMDVHDTNFNLNNSSTSNSNTHVSSNLELEPKVEIDVKDEPTEELPSDDDVEFVHETPSPASSTYEFKFPQELLVPASGGSGAVSSTAGVLPQDIIKTPENGVPPGGYVYWPNAGVFIHPLALQQQFLYYQKMSTMNAAGDDGSGGSTPPLMELPALRKLVPKPAKSKCSSTKSETSEDESLTDCKTKRNVNFDKSPAKRKRSAIFIPPIPTENQNNPATEVSICKFKFTGGAKPSLQEKKMLSVDSGGNFRYYSGTGDKSMRGYEFFPRETLQQQVHNAQGSSTGAFLQASGERIYPSSPVDFTSKVNEFMLTPELTASPQSHLTQPSVSDLMLRSTSATSGGSSSSNSNKKRKSRKSLQREKLEQTFKEKGFLIQTQQLESAEGATYCKFRQLRKFTRYLFRSWKDYLPGNVGDHHEPGLEHAIMEHHEGPPDVEEMNERESQEDHESLNVDQESISSLSSPRARENRTPSAI